MVQRLHKLARFYSLLCTFNKSGRAAAITNFSVFTKVLVGHRLANWHIFFYGNRGTTFAKIFRSSVAAEL